MGNIETENVTLQKFVWKDGSHTCEAGTLLYALTELTDTKSHSTKCSDESVVAYLKDQGFVEERDSCLQLVTEKEQEAVSLGTKISKHIGEQIESIPVDKIIRMVPSIMLSPVPIPAFTKNK